MDAQKEQEQESLDSIDTANKGVNSLAEEAMMRAPYIIANCNKFKKPRLDRIQLYRDLYAGKAKKKFRQPFNVVLPTFAGIQDALAANFNDDLALEYDPQEPADYIAARKMNALWQMEVSSLAPNAMFAFKTRTDRANALLSGRGFMMNYGVSEPEYKNVFDVYELDDAIFQPAGGGIMENHLYQGRENIFRSDADLERGAYDQGQVKKLLDLVNSATDHFPQVSSETRSTLGKYKAMGLDVEGADYVGERIFNLVELCLTIRGDRYYIVFSPFYNTWVRFDRLKSIFSADLYPATSWATHEDNKNFLSKSYGDDAYGVADATHTLFNQELTNREKTNNNPRAFDMDMFPDVAKLDQAQNRPDALIPADTKGGAKKISEGIYSFQVGALGGTINLLDWMKTTTQNSMGVTDLTLGAPQGTGKRATVQLSEENALSKRYILRSSSYTEALGRIGRLFIQSAKDHLPAEKALKRLGIEGQGWDATIRRLDLDTYGDIDVRVKSSTIEMKESMRKQEARLKALDMVAKDPALAAEFNPRWRAEETMRSLGNYDDAELQIGMDTKNYGSKEEVARAHQGIQAIQHREKPETFYGATTLFMQIIHDFAINNRNTLGDAKYHALLDYEMAHAPIVQENMARKAASDAAAIQGGQVDPNAVQPKPQQPAI